MKVVLFSLECCTFHCRGCWGCVGDIFSSLGSAGFPDVEVWLDRDAILAAVFILIISGGICGAFGTPIGGAIAYGLKK